MGRGTSAIESDTVCSSAKSNNPGIAQDEEGFAKRRHASVFKNSLNNALGESEEPKLWLDVALDCEYVSPEKHQELTAGYEQTSAMLWTLMTRWRNLE